ncbi:Mortality factor 4-like protein 2 [Euphorbia peplus]|nr:Mortality factor 4-like protein 2 [Euphorbia peplus]
MESELCVNETLNDEEENPSRRMYQVNEKVLALHSGKWWQAKVLEIRYESNTCKYFVHYIRWKKRWDEWLEVESLKKYTDENVQNFICKEPNLKKYTKAAQALAIKGKVRRGKKRRRGSLCKENIVLLENFVNLQFPSMLKKQLLDDCEFVSVMGKLVKLPRSPNVETILRMFAIHRKEEDGKVTKALEEFATCLSRLFNKALPAILLFKSEREQYADAIKDDSPPSAVYGAEHLLRLFVKLPELLGSADIEEETLMLLQTKFVSFLKFLKQNRNSFFLSTYHGHAPEDTEASTKTNREDD